MKIFKAASIAALLMLCVFASLGQEKGRDPEKEKPILDELRTLRPDAVDEFSSATQALDAGNFSEAERLYSDVLKKVPDFEPALRRLGYTYVAMGRRKEGLELAQKALTKNRSADNLVGKASILVSSDDPKFQPTQAEMTEALSLAREGWQKYPEPDEQTGVIIAEMLLATRQDAEFQTFAKEFKQKIPDSPAAGYYNAIALANEGDLDAAEAQLKQIKEQGVPDETTEPLLTAINKARDESYFGFGSYIRYLWYALYLVVLWAVGLLGLFVVGRLLSSATLRSIETSDPNDVSGQGHAGLRKLYRKVIAAAGIYYYFSQPFVIFLVVAATLGMILGFLWIGTVPVKLVLILVFVGLAAIYYMVKSLFVRHRPEDPGRLLTEEEAPGLWRLAREVARTVQTRPVTEIRITHTTELAVYERGSLRSKMTDTADRILIIGAGVLNDFDQNAFRAVLAHEYGHFSNRDTAGGDIAYRVNSDILRVAESIMMSGTATPYNLGFQFLRLYHFLFRRITHGATRLQEVLADRVAAYHFGPSAFREGLTHVVRRGVEFSHLANTEINAALGANRPIHNLYEMSVLDESVRSDLETEFATALNRPTTEDDTHPSPKDRFRYVDRVQSEVAEPLNGCVWDLFAYKNAITSEMNSLIEKLVRPGADPGILGLG